ncbi:Minor histocompatibility antigen H13 [Smittium mucronatum]|uniref:Minor histocompatibility antigen H13 n=1 Tax=Smittium mucronatum TaxID=133383 RepID=A0A1R0GSB8_9FUNG|nr:Minor histocompatibility antigen H13 [Smittium mucronatum]
MSSGYGLDYLAIASMALAPIFYGSFESISRLKGPGGKKSSKAFPEFSDSDDSEEETESVSSNDAYMFPIYGSISLFSLYIILKYFDKDYVNMLLMAYFAVAGVGALTDSTSLIAKKLTGLKLPLYHLSLTHKFKQLFDIKFTNLHLASLLFSTILVGVYMYTKNWILSNIIGLCFSFSALKLMKLDSIKTGIIMLSGLFFYDIFWVFGTEVMVSVAKNLDAPIKLVFPRNIFDPKSTFMMLGLGDIVIPGIFIALCLRFDHSQYLKSIKYAPKKALPPVLGNKKIGFPFPHPYFSACFISYILGLVTTFTVMYTFKAAQPALLYLSPACSLSVVILAIVRGELDQLFSYSEESEEKSDAKKETKSSSSIKSQTEHLEKIQHAEVTPNLSQNSFNPKKSALSPSSISSRPSASQISAGELADDEQDSQYDAKPSSDQSGSKSVDDSPQPDSSKKDKKKKKKFKN